MILNEISLCTERVPTPIFFVHISLLSYKPVKVYRNDMDHPVFTRVTLKITKNFRFNSAIGKSFFVAPRMHPYLKKFENFAAEMSEDLVHFTTSIGFPPKI